MDSTERLLMLIMAILVIWLLVGVMGYALIGWTGIAIWLAGSLIGLLPPVGARQQA